MSLIYKTILNCLHMKPHHRHSHMTKNTKATTTETKGINLKYNKIPQKMTKTIYKQTKKKTIQKVLQRSPKMTENREETTLKLTTKIRLKHQREDKKRQIKES